MIQSRGHARTQDTRQKHGHHNRSRDLTDLTRGSMLGYLAGGGAPVAARGGETRRIVGAVGASAMLGVEGEAEVLVETGIVLAADTSGRVGGRNRLTDSLHRVHSNAAPVGQATWPTETAQAIRQIEGRATGPTATGAGMHRELEGLGSELGERESNGGLGETGTAGRADGGVGVAGVEGTGQADGDASARGGNNCGKAMAAGADGGQGTKLPRQIGTLVSFAPVMWGCRGRQIHFLTGNNQLSFGSLSLSSCFMLI
jgi:hypothetical protein